MSDYQRLKNLLQATPYVTANGASGEVTLVDRKTAFRLMTEAGPFQSQLVMDARTALEGFSRLDGVGKDDREFSLRDVAKIAGLSYQLAYHYLSKGVIVPSIRAAGGSGRGDVEARFSWEDAYCAGIVGSLRRHGLKLEVLRKVRPLFTRSTTKKRTGRKVATSRRS